MSARKPRSREKPTKGTLEVTVHDSDGEPRRRMRVLLSSGRNELGEILTDADGVVEFPNLTIGQTYFVRVNGDEACEEVVMERVKEPLDIEYDNEIVRGLDEEEPAEEEDEDLDSSVESLDEIA